MTRRAKRISGQQTGLSGVGLFLYALACELMAYSVLGPDGFGLGLMVMVGIVWLMGATGKLENGTARNIIVLMSVLGIGSIWLLAQGMGMHAAVARGLVGIIFVFTLIAAVGTFLKIVLGLLGLAMIVLVLVVVSDKSNMQPYEETEVVEGTLPEAVDEVGEDPSNPLRSHRHEWRDYKSVAYMGKLEVWFNDFVQSARHKKGLRPLNTNDSNRYWGDIYQKLINQDTEYMGRVLSMFWEKAQEAKLDQVRAAEMIVAGVQEIPYKLIYAGSCSELPQKAPHLAELANTHGCKGNVPYGLQAPTEFMYDLQGDCDTRTVFLFTILNKLGYKVCILNSDTYGHSMLGVALPGIGKYKLYNGQKYYFWETTAKGWEMGILPPEMGKIDQWNVVLAN